MGDRRRLLGVLATPLAANLDRIGRMLRRHADRVPAHARAVVLDFHGGEDVGAERLLRIGDLDRHIEDRDKALAYEDLLLPLADEDGDLAGMLDRLGGAIAGWHRLLRLGVGRLTLLGLGVRGYVGGLGCSR